MDNTDDAASYAPARLLERIKAQVERLGVNETLLLAAKNVPDRSLRDLRDGHWPNLRRVAQLADAFCFPGGMAELLGLVDRDEVACNPQYLHIAIELVNAAFGRLPGKCPMVCEPHVVALLTSIAYQNLIELRRIDSSALTNKAALHMISVMLRSELARIDRSKS